MTGTEALARIRGWVADATDRPDSGIVWQTHREQLIAEAAGFGFEPCALTKKVPKGDGFTKWQAEFLARHGAGAGPKADPRLAC